MAEKIPASSKKTAMALQTCGKLEGGQKGPREQGTGIISEFEYLIHNYEFLINVMEEGTDMDWYLHDLVTSSTRNSTSIPSSHRVVSQVSTGSHNRALLIF